MPSMVLVGVPVVIPGVCNPWTPFVFVRKKKKKEANSVLSEETYYTVKWKKLVPAPQHVHFLRRQHQTIMGDSPM